MEILVEGDNRMPELNNPIIIFGLITVGLLMGRFLWNMGDYLSGLIFKKEPSKGTRRSCEDCPAMQISTQRVPIIEEKQRILREEKLPSFSTQLASIETGLGSLDENVKKLFSMIEDIWKGRSDKNR